MRTMAVVSFEGFFAKVLTVESAFSGTANDGYNKLVSLSNLSIGYSTPVSCKYSNEVNRQTLVLYAGDRERVLLIEDTKARN